MLNTVAKLVYFVVAVLSPWTAARQAPLSVVLHYLLEFAQIYIHWICDAIHPSHPLPPPSPFAFNLFQHQGLFQWVTLYIRWPRYWNFSFSNSPPNDYSGLICFRIDYKGNSLSLFYSRRNWDLERLSNLSKVKKAVNCQSQTFPVSHKLYTCAA